MSDVIEDKNSPHCGNCRFYFEKYRECRRFPPTVLDEAYSQPRVKKEDWCGEFQALGYFVNAGGNQVL